MTTLSLDVRPDGVAVLTFDQPGSKANVLTDQVWAELEAAIDSLASRTDVRGLVLASAKPGIFIAGADLKLLGDAAWPNDPAVRAFIDRGNRTLFKLEALPFPTCALIDGAALGGGCEVALACDGLLCGPTAKIGLPEVNLGLIPGCGGTQRLPRVMSEADSDALQNAYNLISSGKILDVVGAAYYQIIHVVYAEVGMIDSACSTVTHPNLQSLLKARREKKRLPFLIDQGNFTPSNQSDGSNAIRTLQQVMTRGASLPLRDALALETEAFLQLAGSDESKRRIADFFASRKK
jgi:enoyl-CoA hydratase/carnithine racemase